MIDRKNMKAPLSRREKVVLWLIMLAIRILAPWEYEYQFTEVVKEITTLVGATEEVKA